jgi:hypothetical protein
MVRRGKHTSVKDPEVYAGIDYAKISQKLRKELWFSFDLPASKRLGEADFSAVVSMIRGANRLFVSVGPTGEFYVLDEAGWRLLYKWPGKNWVNWRGTFWGRCYWSAQNVIVFAGFANPQPPYGNALVFIDPETLTVERVGFGGGGWHELFGCIEKDGKLYVTGEYDDAHLYELTDRNTFRVLSNLPSGALWPDALAYFNNNFVVSCTRYRSVWRSPDGVSWTKVADIDSPNQPKGTDLLPIEYTLIVASRKVWAIKSDWSIETLYALPDNAFVNHLVKVANGFMICGAANFRNILLYQPYYNIHNPVALYTGLGMREDCGLGDVAMYGGRLFLGTSGHIQGPYSYDGIHATLISILPQEPVRLHPLTFTPWANTSISAGAVTDPIPMLGYGSALIYFISNTAGTLTISVDMLGDGDWRTYDTVSNVSANSPVWYPMSTTNFARLKLSFSAAATVTAKIFLR